MLKKEFFEAVLLCRRESSAGPGSALTGLGGWLGTGTGNRVLTLAASALQAKLAQALGPKGL